MSVVVTVPVRKHVGTKQFFVITRSLPTALLPTALVWEVMHSPPSVCLSIRLFPLYLWNWLTIDLEVLHVSRSKP